MNKISHIWVKSAEIGSGIAFILMNVLIAAEVVGRYFFGNSSPLRVELTMVTLIFVVYNMAGPVWHEDNHIRMDVLLLKLGARAKAAVSIISDALVVGCTFVWFYFAVEMYRFDITSNTVTDMAFLPLWWEQWVMPLGCLGMVYFAIVRVVKRVLQATGHKVEEIGGKPWSGY